MVATVQQRKEFMDAAKPLMIWLNENCHPHVKAVVDTTGAELLEGCADFTIEYVKD